MTLSERPSGTLCVLRNPDTKDPFQYFVLLEWGSGESYGRRMIAAWQLWPGTGRVLCQTLPDSEWPNNDERCAGKVQFLTLDDIDVRGSVFAATPRDSAFGRFTFRTVPAEAGRTATWWTMGDVDRASEGDGA